MYEHKTRFSDSSNYDEVCVKCLATDSFYDKNNIIDNLCPISDEEYEKRKNKK